MLRVLVSLLFSDPSPRSGEIFMGHCGFLATVLFLLLLLLVLLLFGLEVLLDPARFALGDGGRDRPGDRLVRFLDRRYLGSVGGTLRACERVAQPVGDLLSGC